MKASKGLMLLMLAFYAVGFLFGETNSNLRELIIRQKFDDAIGIIKNTGGNEKTLWQLAYCYFKKGEHSKLIDLLEKDNSRVPDELLPYKYWLLGYAYGKKGNKIKSIDAYSFWMSDTTFPFFEDCGLAYFDYLVEEKRYNQADSVLKIFQKFGLASRLKRSAPIKELELFVKTKPDTAKKILLSLFDKKPAKWVYQLLEANFSPLKPEYYLSAAYLYYRSKQFAIAENILHKCEKRVKGSSPLWAELSYAKALVWGAQISKRHKAIKELEKLLKSGLYDSLKCRVALGQIYRSLGERDKAILELSEAMQSNDLATKKTAIWNLAELYRQSSMWDKCAPLFAQYWNVAGRDDELADNAVLWAGLSYYLAGVYDSALTYFSTIIDQYGRGYEAFEQTALWWKAKTLMRLERYNEAYCALDSILSIGARNYYFYRTKMFYGLFDSSYTKVEGLERLWKRTIQKIDSLIFSQRFSEEELIENNNLKRARFFSEMGILDWGEKEFRNYITSGKRELSDKESWRLFRLADTLDYKGTAFILAIRTSRYIADSTLSLALNYPLFFGAYVESISAEYGLSPLLLLALIHQESAFDIFSTSPADARGLTQITPSTGKRIAKELGIENYNDNLIYDYKLNLALGAYELKRLITECGGDILCALARYNGGDLRIPLWMNYPKEEGEELFLENIDYHETRHYTRRVIANYFSYIELWKKEQ